MAVYAFPTADVLRIRRYDRADAPDTVRVFTDAVRRGAADWYTEAQRIAWAPVIIDLLDWTARRLRHRTWVAERRGEVIGFTDLTSDGEIDMLYVHPEHTRSGVGRALLDEAERCAREADMPELHARASLVGEPVFRRHGFDVVRKVWVDLRGERLAQVLMHKLLEPQT